MMGRAIVPAQTGPIHTESNVQFLDRHVVNGHIVGSLEECRINREKRLQSLGSQSAREQRGMFLRDANVEIAIGMSGLKKSEAGSTWHRRRDRDNLPIRVGEFRQ